ncbi:MAG: protein kinase [Candidatus Woesearchaeota archaeon]|jgi:serine/threonine protein kinase
MSDSPTSLEIVTGTHIGPYEIIKPLGRGTWKRTFKASRTDGTEWALKFYNPTTTAQKIATDRGITEESFWRKECRNGNNGSDYLASQILETYDELTFLAEELFEGTLEDKLQEQHQFGESETLDIAVRLAKGLAEFHERYKVPHGDVKPGNIGFSKEKVKLFDYGTATVHLGGRGSNTYRAPETFSQQSEFSCATDIWSYGLIMYKLITGKDIITVSSGYQDINIEVHQQLEGNIKDKRMRRLLSKCLNAYERSRIQNGTQLAEEVEEIIQSQKESKRIKHKLVALVKPVAKVLAVGLAGGLIGGAITYGLMNPYPPVRLEIPTIESNNKNSDAALSEGFSVLYQEERQGLIDNLIKKRKTPLPAPVFGMEDTVYGELPRTITYGNELSRATEYQHVATLIEAYENTRAHFGMINDSSRIGYYIFTDYQLAMNSSTDSYASDPFGGQRLFAKILSRNIAQLAEQRGKSTYVDLENICTASIVGTTQMYQAMLAAEETGSSNWKDFSVYIDAKRDGKYIISHEKTKERYEQEPISIAEFLKVFVQYAHQSTVPVQDFQPLVISE